MHRSVLLRRLALPALLTAFCATVVLAEGPPPPDPPPPPPPIEFDSTRIGFIEHVRIGTSPCDTCPPRVCPGEPVQVTISGMLPSPCVAFRGFRELPVGAPFTVLAADFVADTCGRACPTVMVPFAATLSLPGSFATSGAFVLQHQLRSCPDTFTVAAALSRQYTYKIEPNCAVPPSPDSLARTLVAFDVLPARRCAGDSLRLQLRKNGCPSCVHLASFAPDTGGLLRAVVEWRPLCAELTCRPESLSVPLGRFAAGLHAVAVRVDVRVLDTVRPDSVLSYAKRVLFEVPRTCDSSVTDCVPPLLTPPAEPFACAVRVAAGGRAPLTLAVTSPQPVGGLQGRIDCSAPFRVQDVRPPAGSAGLQISWVPEGRGARYVLLSPAGAPLPPGRTPVLELVVAADAAAHDGDEAALFAGVQVASGPLGESLPLCDISAVRLAPVRLCVASPDTCDANGDGRADVRDLVRMTWCLRDSFPGPDRDRVCADRDGDGAFTFADLVHCARFILRAPLLPRDSVTTAPDVRVSFGVPERAGDSVLLPVRVSGAGSLAGTMVRLAYPAERWEAGLPVGLADGVTDPNTGWLPLADVEEPGRVSLTWLRLGEGVADEQVFQLAFRPKGAPMSADAVRVDGVDLVLPDGTALTPAGPLASFVLTSPAGPATPAAIELGRARPNPFARSTSFSVSLPREADVDLSVHDIAGRRVATLASGRLAAGPHDYAWDGAGARDGVYFVRLTVDGRVLSTRVALLRDGR